MGILDLAIETSRREITRDDKYFKKMLYFFEIRVPEGATQSPVPGGYLHPLVMPPTGLQMSEPFAVEKSFTTDGGLFVEENGILAREITLSGTTGFRPRTNVGQSDFDLILPPESKSFTRKIQRRTSAMLSALSGQKHFQYLQDAVFRTYGDLKRDPATSAGTEMYFHNTKDDERWRVVPLSFDLERSGAKPNSYEYRIKLLAVEGTSTTDIATSEDQNVLDALKDDFRMLKYGVQTIETAILDLSGVQAALDDIIVNGTSLIDDAGRIAQATSKFLDGTDRFIKTPINGVTRTKNALEDGLDALDKAVTLGSSSEVPGSLLNSIRRVQDGLLVLASYPDSYQNSVEAAVDSFNNQQALSRSQSSSALQSAEDAGPVGRIRDFARLGTALMPGDNRRASEELGLGRAVPRYTSATERTVEQGDTLTNLAAKYLGDARQWKILAIFNALQPPYISDQNLPYTLGVGETILIPGFGKSDRRRASLATLGVPYDAPPLEHFLGVDALLEDGPDGRADFVVDTAGGSVDIKLVRGLDNLSQGLRTRIRTERGSDILYRNLGMRRVIGVGVTALDLEQVQYTIIDTIQADPRVSSVAGLTFDNLAETPDVLDIDMDVSVRGLTRAEKVRVAVK